MGLQRVSYNLAANNNIKDEIRTIKKQFSDKTHKNLF